MIKNPVLRIHPKDNLLVALSDLETGYEYRDAELAFPLVERIPQKQKFTQEALAKGEAGLSLWSPSRKNPNGSTARSANHYRQCFACS